MAKNRNKESTRYYSEAMEDHVASAFKNGHRQPNSGAAKFNKGDVVTNSFLIECKVPMAEKDSFSIKKEWIEKNRLEAFQIRKPNQALAIRFSPEGETFYLIPEKLMKELVEYLEEER